VGPSNSSEGGAIDLPAKSPSSKTSSHIPVRVLRETHRTLAVCLNRGADFGMTIGSAKKGLTELTSRIIKRRNFRGRRASL
jgi:hypothetical protein